MTLQQQQQQQLPRKLEEPITKVNRKAIRILITNFLMKFIDLQNICFSLTSIINPNKSKIEQN